jgi:hypothetical protein
MNDKTRHAMYRIEAHVYITCGLDGDLDVHGLRELARRAWKSPWWDENGTELDRLDVRLHHQLDSESWFTRDRWAQIRLGPGEYHLGMLCHELAHVALGDALDVPEHSMAWLATYCSLLRLFGHQTAAARMWHELLPYFEDPLWDSLDCL